MSWAAGRMGIVYRARDTKLRREVAIKVLPEELQQDPERRARFEREARVLATLNHPNIASIYQLEESEGVHFLVRELVEGEDLAERLSRGPLTVEEALPVFVHDLESGLTSRLTDFGNFPQWLRDGRRLLYYHDEEPGIWLFHTRTGDERMLLSLASGNIDSFTLSPDNGTIYFVRQRAEGDIWVAELSRL